MAVRLMSALRKLFFYPLFGLYSRSPKLSYLKELEITQHLSMEQLKAIQLHRLQEFLHFVWNANDFYRDRFQKAGVGEDDFNDPNVLFRLPVLTKSDVRTQGIQLLSKGFDRSTLQAAKTGGSTGKALELFYTEECSELRNACALRHDRWTGWELGEPIAACWGNPHLPKSWKEKLAHRLLQPMIYLDTMSVSEQAVEVFVGEWRQVRPTLLFGHAHSIFLLAQFLREMQIDDLRPRGILSTSMMLVPSERTLIEKVFDCKVIDRYGCEEVSLIACECERHEGMHLNIEHLFIEFLKEDDTPAGPGELGRIVVTDLMNRAMPMIRYEVEDVGVPTDHRCSCGRGLPLMEKVIGRRADFLVRKDGSRVAGISLIENTLTHFPGLDQMQIIQHQIDQFEIAIVQGADFSESTVSALLGYFQQQFGSDITFNFRYAKELLPEENGKFRFSICKIN